MASGVGDAPDGVGIESGVHAPISIHREPGHAVKHRVSSAARRLRNACKGVEQIKPESKTITHLAQHSAVSLELKCWVIRPPVARSVPGATTHVTSHFGSGSGIGVGGGDGGR